MFGVEEPEPEDAPETLGYSLNVARLRKIQLETERIQLALDRERGELISRASVREAGVHCGAAFAAEAAALVNDLPGMLAGLSEREIQAVLAPRVAKMQEDINARLREID